MRWIRRSARWMFGILGFWMTVGTGWAQPAGPAEAGVLPPPVPFPSLTELLPAIEQGNTRKVTEILSRVEDFVHRTGTRYMPELAMALWQAGLKAREKGDLLVMDQCSRLALQLDPTNPYFHIALAWYQFHNGPRSWGLALRHTWQGLGAIARRPGGRGALVHWMAEWSAWVALILMATLGLLAGLQLGPLFVHDALERWSLRGLPWMAYVLAAATVGFVFPWLGGLWNLLWVGVLLIGYMPRRQRIVWLGLAGLVVGLTCLAYLGQAAYERYERAPRKWILAYSEYGMSPSLMYAMYNALQQTPRDLPTLLLYGHGFIRHGYYREAEATYRWALQYFPNHPAVLNNLGNVYFFQENYAQAIEYYRAAEDQPIPDSKLRAYVLYNHGRALQSRLEFAAGEAKVQEALKTWPDLAHQPARGMALDYLPTRSEAFGSQSPAWFVTGLRQWVRDRRLWVLLILGGLWGLLRGVRWPAYRARACYRCGTPYCPNCVGVDVSRPYCSQCLHLFVVKDGLSPDRRQAKLQQIVRHEHVQVLVTTVVDLLIPGGGWWLRTERLSSLLRLIAWSGAWTFFLVPSVRPDWLIDASLVPIFILAGWVTLLGIYGLNLIWVLIHR
ncbi:hypothetical protein HRbin11_01539 [bacterium HR11]|nr:hypothetical protein HRbin11_01539 [bacterium HR11]